MIKVGILGAESHLAGELLRLLILHPEVEIIAVCSPPLLGKSVAAYHKGIHGETDLRFSDTIHLEDVDVLFIASSKYKMPEESQLPENLNVIVLDSKVNAEEASLFTSIEFYPAVSEMFRKPLVRTARGAKVLSAPTSVALIALFPLALHLLLNDRIKIKVTLPGYHEELPSSEKIARELEKYLHEVQLSFNKIAEVEIERSEMVRALSMEIEFPCTVSVEEIEKAYESVYDDHNFTFLTHGIPSPEEVASTQKCLISVSRPEEGIIRINAVADSVMRGGAGDAVHAMNLLFGLFEKTGLSLPASLAFRKHKD